MTENSENFISYNFLFTINSIFLSGNILDVNKKKGNCTIIHEPKQLVTLQHTLQPSLHVTGRQVQKEQEYQFQ
jgi:hypothetical protein